MTPLARAEARKPVRRGEQIILFAVGGTKFGISAAAVDEIRANENLKPIANGVIARATKARYILEREGEMYFVVDTNVHLRMLPTKATRILVLRGSCVALLVDAIDRMAEIPVLYSLPRAFEGEEREWYRGLAIVGEDVVPVVNPASFLTDEEIEALRKRLGRRAAQEKLA